MRISKCYKPYLFVTLCFVNVASLSSQTEPPDIIPASPSSRMFHDLTKEQVNVLDGRVNVSIPLYNIKVGDLEIPIQLRYNNSGIKYGQADGELGVGWVLEPGYRISRSIYGRPDEIYEKPVETDNFNLPNFNSYQERDQYLSNFTSGGLAADPHLPGPTAYWDGEYDIFQYSTPRNGGTFIITNRNNRTIKKMKLDNSEVSFVRKSGSKEIDYFNIVDEDGRTARFGKSMTNGSRYEEKLNEGTFPVVPTAWLLTDIQDLVGNEIRFQYGTYLERDKLDYGEYAIIQGGDDQWSFWPTWPTTIINPGSSAALNRYYVQRLNLIETAHEKIHFQRTSGQDGRMESITVLDSESSILRKILFTYSSNSKHRFLDKVQILNGANVVEEEYTFDYFNKVDTDSYIPDYWGYYKLRTGVASLFPYFGEVYYYEMGGPGAPQPVPAHATELFTHDKNASIAPKYFMLKSIKYPTGGIAEYEYESGEYSEYRDDTHTIGRKIAGIRIKDILMKDNNNVKKKTSFKYGRNEDGIGIVSIDIALNQYFTMDNVSIMVNHQWSKGSLLQHRRYASEILSELSVVRSTGNPVKYDNITVYEEDITSSNKLKTKYRFQINNPYTFSYFYTNSNYITSSYMVNSHVRRNPNYLNFNFGMDDMVLIEKSVYKTTGVNQYVPLKKEEFTYGTHDINIYYGLKVKRFSMSGSAYSPGIDYYSSGIESLCDYTMYSVHSTYKLLKSRNITTYTSGDSVMDERIFFYNKDFLLSKEETITSENKKFGSIHLYTSDYANGTPWINKMRTNNLKYPVERVDYFFEDDIPYIIRGEIKEYQDDGKGLLAKINTLRTQKNIELSNFKFSNTSIGSFPSGQSNGLFSPDLSYQPYFEIARYNIYGKPLEIKRQEHSPTTYLWGYKGQYPIAKIENATYTEVENILGQSTIASLNAANVSDVTITNAMNALRNNPSMQKARVTSYTYKPMVGMTSMTDSRGITEYYKYDGFQRLKDVLDFDKKILHNYQYNYRPY